MTPFWRMALAMAVVGLGLTLAGTLVNLAISKATIDGFMRDWVAENGYGGSTDLTVGILLGNMFVYPMVIGAFLVVVLPVLLGWQPDWSRRPGPIAALIGLPTLVVAALWWAGPSLMVIYTLPAGAIMAAAAGLMVLFARWWSARKPKAEAAP